MSHTASNDHTTATAPDGPPIIVFSSPSGAGKTTQRNLLLAENPRREFLVSYTTRAPRAGEVDGVDYHFLRIGRTKAEAEAEFNRLKEQGDVFFETTEMYGNYYGTPRKQLEAGLAAGKQMIADVNIEGMLEFRDNHPGQVRSIFLQPPVDKLASRLRQRITEAGDLSESQAAELHREMHERLQAVPTIMQQAGFYNYVVHQEHCTPMQTFGLVKQALSAPRTEVGKYSVHHMGLAPSSALPSLYR